MIEKDEKKQEEIIDDEVLDNEETDEVVEDGFVPPADNEDLEDPESDETGEEDEDDRDLEEDDEDSEDSQDDDEDSETVSDTEVEETEVTEEDEEFFDIDEEEVDDSKPDAVGQLLDKNKPEARRIESEIKDLNDRANDVITDDIKEYLDIPEEKLDELWEDEPGKARRVERARKLLRDYKGLMIQKRELFFRDHKEYTQKFAYGKLKANGIDTNSPLWKKIKNTAARLGKNQRFAHNLKDGVPDGKLNLIALAVLEHLNEFKKDTERKIIKKNKKKNPRKISPVSGRSGVASGGNSKKVTYSRGGTGVSIDI